MSEAGIHFDFYFHLRNAIEDTPRRGQRIYDRAEPEYSQDIDGRADLVLFDTTDNPVVVIEAKRPSGASGREIDPYAPAIIKQAHRYASQLGSPYFATFNDERLVLFNTHEEGVPLLKRSTKSYDIGDVGPFADTFLDEIARLEADRISWDSLDDAFIERVQTLHELLTPELEEALATKLDADSEFRELFVDWATAQGIDYDGATANRQTEVRERFAEEGAYLLVNKVLFYKILQAPPPTPTRSVRSQSAQTTPALTSKTTSRKSSRTSTSRRSSSTTRSIAKSRSRASVSGLTSSSTNSTTRTSHSSTATL